MNTKYCPTCDLNKDVSLFYKAPLRKDGLFSECRECFLERAAAYKKTPAGRKKERRYRTSEKGKASHKKYRKSAKGSAVFNRIREKYNASVLGFLGRRRWHKAQFARNRDHVNARSYVQRHSKEGKIPHPKTLKCVSCENMAEHYHHTHGYARENWLKVVAMCASCHRDIHNHGLVGDQGLSLNPY